MIFESHAHYDDSRFSEDREAVLKTFQEAGIGCVINVSADMNSSRKTIELAKKYPFLYGAVGVHPHDVKEMKEEHLETLMHFCAYEKIVAFGEIGLDYHYEFSPKTVQKLWFREQLHLAKELELPVVIHSREAAKETFDILKEVQLGRGDQKGVIHCYSGSLEMAQDYISEGYYIGVGGVVTFSNAKKLQDVVKGIPLERLLIETDAPYLAPIPFRGQRNDSRMLPYIIQTIADIKGISPEEVEEITWQNGQKLFFKGE